jgi:uncharacterized membrane protein
MGRFTPGMAWWLATEPRGVRHYCSPTMGLLKRLWKWLCAQRDNLIAGLLVAGIVVVAGVVWSSYGSRRVALRGWMIIVLILVLTMLFGTVIVLFLRLGRSSAQSKHAVLTDRLCAVQDQLARYGDLRAPAPWSLAETFNLILTDAKAASTTEAIARMPWFVQDSAQLGLSVGYVGDVMALAAQLRVLLAHESR